MAGKFGSVGILSSFIYSTKESDRRFRTNIEAIIDKYEKADPDDDIIDLKSLHVVTSGDSLENHKTYSFGLSKLATTQRRERNQTANSTSLEEKTSKTICDSFFSDDLNASIAEENCTKVFSFICVDDNDPSDAETLSSCSTYSDESWEEFNSQCEGSPQNEQTPTDSSAERLGKQTERHDSDSDSVDKSWYSLKKLASVSSNSSGISKPVQKKSSTMSNFDSLPLNNTPSTRTKVLIPKKVKKKNVTSIDKSSSLNKLEDIPNTERCVSPVKNSLEYEASSEDSAFEPHQDIPCLSYKADIVRAWVNQLHENGTSTELCDSGVFSCQLKQDNAEDKVTIKTEVQDDAQYDAALRTDNRKSDGSAESSATYIIPAGNESLPHYEHNPNLYDSYQMEGTVCAEISFENVFSPQKQRTNSADLAKFVKKSTPSRRILRARKRFKPPLLSMTEQQLQEFFDSPHPDFTMFYASSTQHMDTASDINGYKAEVEDSGTVFSSALKGKNHEQRSERKISSVLNANLNGPTLRNQNTGSVPNNYVNDHQPPKKTSLQPTRLQFSDVCAKNKLVQTPKKNVINCADLTTHRNHSSNFQDNGIEHDKQQKLIITDTTFVIPPSVGTSFERLEKMMEQGRTLKSWNQVIQSVPSNFSKNASKILCHSSIPTDTENSKHSDQKSISSSNNFTVGSSDERSSDSPSSEQDLFFINRQNLKRSERNSLRTSKNPVEMSPVSRLSSLRLSSPIPSRQMTVVSSAKKMKESDMCCLRNENTAGVAVFSSFPKAAITSNIFSNCSKGKTLDVSLGSLKTRKENGSEFPKARRQRSACVSTKGQKPDVSNFDDKLLKCQQDIVCSALPSKCLNSKTTLSLESCLFNFPKGSDKSSIHSITGKTQRPEHWKSMSRIFKNSSNDLLNLPYNLEHPRIHDLNLKKRGLLQKNVQVKRLQKQTSTPVKRHVTPMNRSQFCLNETLSTIADVDADMIEHTDNEDQIITLSP